MKNILLLGAGRSATFLIDYLLQYASAEDWTVHIGDVSVEHLEERKTSSDRLRTFTFDIHNEAQRAEEVGKADLVISLLPALFHIHVARECLAQRKHLITASYISPEIAELHHEAKADGLLFLMECGLDPGIDHMSAMQLIDQIKSRGGRVTSFKSYTGGLIAPESDTNPWHYKITWNPRNVVLAGQGTAKYLEGGRLKYIPYQRLFERVEKMQIGEAGDFEGYANRDSLSYVQHYQLEGVETLLRGTLRKPGYCAAWNLLVQLGMTDDTYQIATDGRMTYRQFTEAYLPEGTGPVESRLSNYLGVDETGAEMERFRFLGLLEEEPIGLDHPTPAQVLEKRMVEKWALAPGDKDLIVMQHQLEYELQGKREHLTSSLVVTGDDPVRTGMAKTVGLPVAIAARLLLQGRFESRGVVMPTTPEFYGPILQELEQYGIHFQEQ